MKWFGSLVVAGVVLVLAACSSTAAPNSSGATAGPTSSNGGLPSPTATPIDETPAAKAMLLTVADFPAGWAETPSSSGDTSKLDKCGLASIPGRTGKAGTGNFSKTGTATFTEGIVTYASPEGANSVLDAAQSLLDCLTKKFNSGDLDDAEAKFSGATLSPLSFPAKADRVSAWRIKVHAQAKQPGYLSQVDFYMDMVYVIRGRVVVYLSAQDAFSPFDNTMFQQLADVALNRIVQP